MYILTTVIIKNYSRGTTLEDDDNYPDSNSRVRKEGKRFKFHST